MQHCLPEYCGYLFGSVHVFLSKKNANFVKKKLLKLDRNIYGVALKNYNNSLDKKFVTMIITRLIVIDIASLTVLFCNYPLFYN